MARWLLVALFIGLVAAIPGGVPRAQAQPVCPATPVVGNVTPVATDGQLQLPTCETIVVISVVNNGPVSPEYQAGYEIQIDTEGQAIVSTKTAGTPEPSEEPVEIGVEGLQQLLAELQTIGFFALPQANSFEDEDIPVGGSVSILSVTLADGTWETRADGLYQEQRVIFDQAQQAVSRAMVPTPEPCAPLPADSATPVAIGGEFPMPSCGTVVIDATVNNGPVAPEFQQGYEITIDTGGIAIVAIKQEGTPTPSVQTVNLGLDGLQQLLQQLQDIGYFSLPPFAPPGPGTPIMVGGPTNDLSVWLGDQTWQVSEPGLSADDLAILNEAQQAIVDAVGVPVP